jgi:hypothetical protein
LWDRRFRLSSAVEIAFFSSLLGEVQMPFLKKLLVFVALACVLVGVLAGVLELRIYRAAHPSLPENMPRTSMWVPGPVIPWDLSPRGFWLGCWIDKARGTVHCRTTDFRGGISFEDDYLPANRNTPVSADMLRLAAVREMDWHWVDKEANAVPIVHLQDGTILVPARDFEEVREKLLRRQ